MSKTTYLGLGLTFLVGLGLGLLCGYHNAKEKCAAEVTAAHQLVDYYRHTDLGDALDQRNILTSVILMHCDNGCIELVEDCRWAFGDIPYLIPESDVPVKMDSLSRWSYFW